MCGVGEAYAGVGGECGEREDEESGVGDLWGVRIEGDEGEVTRSVASIWNNKTIPVIAAPPTGELRIRVPYSAQNRAWLQIGRRRPIWKTDDKYWAVPRSWLNRIARHILGSHGRCYVVQSVKNTEVCAPACWNAEGLDCSCSCNGENHGCDADGSWFVVSEAFACRSNGSDYSVRLIGRRTAVPSDESLRSLSGVKWITYIVRQAGRDVVKIGKSTDVDARLKTLQTASPEPLEILATLDGDHEAGLHKKHAADRVGGEWFRLTPEVQRSINGLNFLRTRGF